MKVLSRKKNPIRKEPSKKNLNRRSFIKALLGFSIFSTIAGVITPILGYLIPPERTGLDGSGKILAGTTTEIPVGQAKIVPMGNKPVIITNTTQGYRAFSATCTHLGCICVWDDLRQIILCPCHDGQFNAVTGAVMSGPPPSPLPPVSISVDGENIYIGEV